MYKTFSAILNIIWVLDVLNLPFMEFLDTKYPINGVAWLVIWLVLGLEEYAEEHHKQGGE